MLLKSEEWWLLFVWIRRILLLFVEVGRHPWLFPSKAHRALNRSLAGRTCSLALERSWKQLYRPCALFNNQATGSWIIACNFETERAKDLECKLKAQIFISAAINVWSKRNLSGGIGTSYSDIPGRLARNKYLATALDRTCRPVPERLLLFHCHNKQRWQVIWIWPGCCGFCVLSTMLERI